MPGSFRPPQPPGEAEGLLEARDLDGRRPAGDEVRELDAPGLADAQRRAPTDGTHHRQELLGVGRDLAAAHAAIDRVLEGGQLLAMLDDELARIARARDDLDAQDLRL